MHRVCRGGEIVLTAGSWKKEFWVILFPLEVWRHLSGAQILQGGEKWTKEKLVYINISVESNFGYFLNFLNFIIFEFQEIQRKDQNI